MVKSSTWNQHRLWTSLSVTHMDRMNVRTLGMSGGSQNHHANDPNLLESIYRPYIYGYVSRIWCF